MADSFGTLPLPNFSQYMPSLQPVATPQATVSPNADNWLVAGLKSGAYGALSSLGSAGQGAATLVGATDLAAQAKSYADQQKANAAAAGRPDLEQNPWSLPGMGYQLAQGLPSFAGALAGAGLATIGAPVEAAAGAGAAATGLSIAARQAIGAGLTVLPQAIGSNVQTSEDANGPLTQGQAAKAIALGVPEAALQAIVPGHLEGILNKGIAGGLVGEVAKSAAIQGGVGAATAGLTSLMGDPNRTFADRANDMLQAALGGAFQGAVFSGAIGGIAKLAKKPVAEISTDDLQSSTAAVLEPNKVPEPAKMLTDQRVVAGQAPSDIPPRPYADLSKQDLMQQFMRLREDPSVDPLRFQRLGEEIAARNGETQQATPDAENYGSRQVVPATPPGDLTEVPNRGQEVLDPAQEGPTAPAPPSNAVEGPPTPAALPSNRPFADQTKFTDEVLNNALNSAYAHIQAGGEMTATQQDVFKNLLHEKAMRQLETQPQAITDESAPRQPLPDDPQATPPKTVLAGPPDDIPSRVYPADKMSGQVDFSGLSDDELSHARANDPNNPDILEEMAKRVSPETRAAGIAKDILDVAKGVGANQVPQFLRGKTFTSEDDLRQEIAKEIQSRFENGKDLSKTLGALGDKYQVFDDQQQVKPELLAPRNDIVGASEAAPPARAAPSRDSIPDQHQTKFDAIEKLREAMAHQNIPDTDVMGLQAKADDLQTRLQVPGEAGKVVKETKALQAEIAGKAAEAARKAAEPPSAPAATPVAPDAPPSPKALSFAERMQQAKLAKRQAYEASKAQEKPKGPAPKTQAEAVAQKQAQVPSKAPADPRLLPLKQALVKAKQSLGNLMNYGKTRQDIRAETITKQDRAKRSAIKTAMRTDQSKVEQARLDARAAFDKALDEQDKRITQVQKIVNSGDPEAIRALYESEKAKDKPVASQPVYQGLFGSNLSDNFYDGVDSNTRKLIAEHDNNEAAILKALKSVHGDESLSVAASGPITQGDRDLEHVINQGGSGADLLRYLQLNGSTGDVRDMATRLLASGADPDVNFADPSKFKLDSDRQLQPGETIKGSYNPAIDRVNLYDRSNLEQTVLHEVAHAATQKAIDRGTPAGKELQGIFDRLKARSGDNDAYGLTNAKEMVAEAFSNPTFRDFLKGERVSTGSKVMDMWQGLKNAVFKALGLGERQRSLFDQIMDTSHRAMDENTGKGFDSESPLITNDKIKRAAARLAPMESASVEAVAHSVRTKTWGFGASTLKAILGWVSGDHLVHLGGKDLSAIGDLRNALALQQEHQEAVAKTMKAASMQARALDMKTQKMLNKAMSYTAYGLDIFKSWQEHKWLHAPEDRNAASLAKMSDEEKAKYNARQTRAKEQATRSQAAHAEAQKLVNEIRKNPKALDAYQRMRDANAVGIASKDAYHMYNLVANDFKEFGLKGFETNPMTEFAKATPLHDNPAAARQFWEAKRDQMHASLSELATEFKTKLDNTANPLTPEQVKETKALRTPVKSMVDQVKRSIDQQKQGAYFHLGREGTRFATGRIATDATGLPDQNAVAKLEETLHKFGINDAVIQHNAENNHVYLSLRDMGEEDQARAAFKSLEGKGIEEGSISSGAAQDPQVYNKVSPQWMLRAIAAMRAEKPELPDGVDDKAAAAINAAHAQHVRDTMQALMAMLPDSNINKVFSKRESVQGFNPDMIHSFETHAMDTSRMLGGLFTAQDRGQAARNIRQQVKDINKSDAHTTYQRDALGKIATEALLRESQAMLNTPTPGLDAIKRISHVVTLGMSPAYFAMLMSQIPTLSLPRLGATHGFLKAAQSMGKVTPMTFKVVGAIVKSREWKDFALRDEYLKKAGVPDDVREFIMTQAGRGSFNLGSYTNSMVGHEPQGLGKVQHYMHDLSALSLYAEMIPRVLTALAARDLYRGKEMDGELHDFVSEKVRNSQLDWSQGLSARQLGKGGTMGGLSPLVNQFMGFQIRMTELLYREAHSATVGMDPTAKATSQKFLLAHLAATTAFAGVLGLPFVGVAASVYDRLADWATGQDDHDIMASFRTHLANAFGKDVGEAIARGAPRLGGFDFSRAGEATILPGSTTVMMLTEKRKLEDAEKDWLKAMAGSSVGTAMTYATAFRDMSNGDYMNASIKLAPEGIKNALEAVQLGHRGFVNKDGAKLPITASAQDVALKLFGLEGSKEMEYNEARRTDLGLQTMKTAREQNITHHLLQAYNRGDTADFAKWRSESDRFGHDHPGAPPPIASFGEAMSKLMQEQSMARALGTPIGVKPNDLIGRGMTSFGNFRNQ